MSTKKEEKETDPKSLNLHQKLSAIQIEFKANKSRFNSFGKYNFRSAEDILEGLKPMIAKYDVVFTVSEEMISCDPPIMKSVAAIHATNGDTVRATAIVGVDLNQKGMQVPQQYGSASSYAKKYALGNLLLIDDTVDSDGTNTHNSVKPQLKAGSAEFQKAREFLDAGGSMELIKKKYEVSKSVELSLTTGK